jgi:xanthine dehydrogenase small subunit
MPDPSPHAMFKPMPAAGPAPETPSGAPHPTRPIRFWHGGALREVSGLHPTRSVLDWLREDARCTGTKEGCNEGDCGACTVAVGELDATAPGCELRP